MPEPNPFDDVYDVVRLIPPGCVTSYGTIASYLGSRGGARLVGWAMNACHGLGIPAHRVVNSKGLLTGKAHFGGNRMQELLESEGVQIKNDQVVDFQKRFWDPAVELL